MLEKERFLEIKEIAHRIRKENDELFESLKNVSLEEAIQEKEEFIEAVINGMGIEFSDGELGKEEVQIFRANVLIPDDVEFFQTYSKDKNIRNLMNRYMVSIEDVMSKITELNIYGKYTDAFSENKEENFVEEMIKEKSAKDDAMDLLDEIKALTSDIDNALEEMEAPIIQKQTLEVFATPLDEIEEIEIVPEEEELNLLEPEEIPAVNIEVEISSDEEGEIDLNEIVSFEEEVEDMLSEETPEDTDLNDMSAVVTSFVEKYNNLESQNKKMKEEMDKLQLKLSELSSELEGAENKVELLEKENADLKEENMKISSQAAETKALISKIYSCIAPKE